MTDAAHDRTGNRTSDRSGDRTKGRVIDRSVEVPGTPDEVWAAIATGPGIASWFVPHEVEEGAGGAVSVDFGDLGAGKASVVTWEPPHRVVFASEGERALAYAWTVEAKDGGTCVVRLVNSGFGPGQEWDADYDGMSEGWKLFLENLRLHRTYFPGRRARAVLPTGFTTGPLAAGWERLCAAVGIAPDAAPGTSFATSGDGVPVQRGRVETALTSPRLTSYLVVLDTPVPGTGILAAESAGDQVMVSFYQYRYGAGAETPARADDAWNPFFATLFPMPQPG